MPWRPRAAGGRMPACLGRLAARIARPAEALAHARLRPRARRREGLIAGPMLIITGIAALLGVAVVSILFQKELSATFLFLFTSMPRFDAAVSADGTVAAGNALYEMYLNFRTISFFVMSVAIVIAGLTFGLESINVVPPRAASKILGNGMLYLVVIMVFPHFWDIVADAVEWLSLWILSPDDPSRAHDTVATLLDYMSPGRYPEVDYARLFGGAGSALAEAAFSSIVDFVTMREGDGALRAIGEGYERTITALLTEVLLFFLKAIALLTMSLTAFLLGTVRYVLTGLLAVAVPLVLALSLLPQFARVTALMRDTLVALTIVPLFSALAVAAGVAVLEGLDSEDFGDVDVVIAAGDVGRDGCAAGAEGCEEPEALVPPPSVQELTHGVRKFFMALAVLALAIYFPAMLAPMISRIMSSVQQHVSTSGLAGTMLLSGARAAVSRAPAATALGYRAVRSVGHRASDLYYYGLHAPKGNVFSEYDDHDSNKFRPYGVPDAELRAADAAPYGQDSLRANAGSEPKERPGAASAPAAPVNSAPDAPAKSAPAAPANSAPDAPESPSGPHAKNSPEALAASVQAALASARAKRQAERAPDPSLDTYRWPGPSPAFPGDAYEIDFTSIPRHNRFTCEYCINANLNQDDPEDSEPLPVPENSYMVNSAGEIIDNNRMIRDKPAPATADGMPKTPANAGHMHDPEPGTSALVTHSTAASPPPPGHAYPGPSRPPGARRRKSRKERRADVGADPHQDRLN